MPEQAPQVRDAQDRDTDRPRLALVPIPSADLSALGGYLVRAPIGHFVMDPA